MRNRIHPVTVFAIFVTGLALLFFGIAGEFYAEQYRYSYAEWTEGRWNSEDFIAFCVFLGIGSFWLVGAVGLALRKNWARILIQVGLILAGLIWLLLVGTQFREMIRNPFMVGGVTAGILGLVVGSLLFLNNAELVLPFFGRGGAPEPYTQVLDEPER
ncbi:MAG: hypothetical protein KDC54_24730, partial [Lewinella sp.]|nr:hypothetical protein [Lewinella sp.]